MTPATQTRINAVHALVVFGVAALFSNLVRSANDPTGLWEDRTVLPRGECMYQVLRNEECVGTVFAEGPLTVPEILRRAGIVPERHEGPGGHIPGGTAIRLVRDSLGVTLSKIPGPQLVTVGRPIDVNRADETDFTAVPGIGPALARRVIEERDRRGKFSDVVELRQVSGIGPKKFAALRRWVYVEKAAEESGR